MRSRTLTLLALGIAVLAVVLPVSAQHSPAPNVGGYAVGFNSAVDYSHDNFAYSPNIRKFVDSLPGLGPANANNLGQYIPIATATPYTDGADFYHIGVAQYQRKLHSDLPPTTLRGYFQFGDPATDPINGSGVPQYLGPLILAKSFDPTKQCNGAPCYNTNGNGAPVRIQFENKLPVGGAGDLFLPVDRTLMGAGPGPVTGLNYTDNRAVIHLHGGNTPWISDGTPHQWITPVGAIAGAATNDVYRKGVSFQNVPDMVGTGNLIPAPAAGDGIATYYYTNQQSQRLMFYHDHSYGITRLNVYGGMAAGYLLTDQAEDDMISSGVLPDHGIPLVIQDKTFVNDGPLPSVQLPAGAVPTQTTATTDPLWYTGVDPNTNKPYVPNNCGPTAGPLAQCTAGNLWFPHEYMPNENIFDGSGALAWGRWDYGPWLNPPLVPINPTLPSPSHVPETFADTMLVNGTAYPYLNVDPHPYRFRILSAGNDRSLNLQLYVAASKQYDATPGAPNPLLCDGTVDINTGVPAPVSDCTEVKMVPAKDGRNGGIPDPKTAGPDWIQIGNEGGILPQAAVIPAKAVNYEYNRRVPTMLNVTDQSLLLMPAERADVLVDFTCFAGKTLILYNDGPAPMPLFDERNDLYTGNPDMRAIGGPPTIPAGYGPNTRTVMQINVSGTPIPAGTTCTSSIDVKALNTALAGAYGATQPRPIVKQSAYNAAFGTANGDTYVQNVDATVSSAGAGQGVSSVMVTLPGSGYLVPPIVTFVPKDGNGSGAAATACLNGVTGLTVTVSGAGYVAPPAVTFSVPKNLKGSGATAVASISGGGVSAIAITNPGCNYNGNPVVTVAPPPCTINGTTCVQATAAANVTLGGVASITLVKGPNGVSGSGYTKAPFVFLKPAPGDPGRGATADSMLAGDMVIGMKNITEGFEPWFGRMNVQLGTTPVPLDPFTPAPQVPGIAMYIDPPSDFFNDEQPQVFRIAHLGVDSHIVHFHLVNLQVVNRVDFTNTMYPPLPGELGWKESIRTNPFTDLIVAVMPVSQWLPFQIPQSNRLMDPTSPAGSTANYLQPAPVAGLPNPAGISNVMTNYGWEYVWHCHLLGHEENDMMRPLVFNVPIPSTPVLTASVATPGSLSWTSGGSSTRTYRIQRSSSPLFSSATEWQNIGFPPATTFTDTGGSATSYYRVRAENGAGVSAWSGIVGPPMPPLTVSATAVTNGKNAKTDTITVTWTMPAGDNQTGITVQYATNPGFTGSTSVNLAATATTYAITNAQRAVTYYIQVRAFNASGTSTPVGTSVLTP